MSASGQSGPLAYFMEKMTFFLQHRCPFRVVSLLKMIERQFKEVLHIGSKSREWWPNLLLCKRGSSTLYEIYIGFCPRSEFKKIHIKIVYHISVILVRYISIHLFQLLNLSIFNFKNRKNEYLN